MLALPVCFSSSGLALSIVIFLVCTFIGYETQTLLTTCAYFSKKYSYMSLSREMIKSFKTTNQNVSKIFPVVVKVTFFLTNLGFAVAQYLVLKQMLPYAIEFFFSLGKYHTFVGVSVTFVISFGLGLFRTYSDLRFIYFNAFLCALVMIIIIIIEAFKHYEDWNWSVVMENNFSGISQKIIYKLINFQALTFPIAVFAYANHCNVLDIFHEMQSQVKLKVNKIFFSGNSIITILYIAVGSFGFLTFSNNLDELNSVENSGIILLADYQDSFLIKIAIIAMLLQTIASLPLTIKPAKDSLVDIIKPGIQGNDSNLMHVMLIILICGICGLTSILVKKISDILTLLGATLNPLICYHYPIIFYLFYSKKLLKQDEYNSYRERAKRILLIILFFGMLILGVYSTIDFFLQGGFS